MKKNTLLLTLIAWMSSRKLSIISMFSTMMNMNSVKGAKHAKIWVANF